MAQSKWTISDIQTAVASYVAAAKQADPDWTPDNEPISGLIETIMKIMTIDGNFNDKLPELDGEDLPFGQAIEEFFISLVPDRSYNDFENDYPDGSDEGAAAAAENRPYRPNFEQVYFDERLGRKVFATTVDENKYQEALIGEADYSNIVALIMKRLYDSYSVWKYNVKKNLLGNLAQKALAVNTGTALAPVHPLVVEMAAPTDTETGEAFIKTVKNIAEEAQDMSENTSLSCTTIGAEDGLVAYIDHGIMSSIEVDTLAGAFNSEKLALPLTVKVISGFGKTPVGGKKPWCVICDPRGVKLHRNYEAVRDTQVAVGDYHNFFLHTEHTGFISPYTYVKVFVAPDET